MKRRMKFFVALDAALSPIVGVLISIISSNFPSIPWPVLWSVTGAILVFAIFVGIIIAINKHDKEDA